MEIPGIGTYFPEYFDDSKDYFATFNHVHTTQTLTESDKGDVAYRKGVYLSEVTDDYQFKLLRCSSNLFGPTESFSRMDRDIIAKLNVTNKELYKDGAELNHVLAQVYHNYSIDGRERRAKIARHSDKTKDMSDNGLIVFCTFYDSLHIISKRFKPDPNDKYNILYKNTTALTTLRFIQKEGAVSERPKCIDVLLYPNSALFMDLEANRLYTHEIVPPNLDARDVPTRLGYVVRCSKQDAKFVDGRTLIQDPAGQWGPLNKPTQDEVKHLKELYRVENQTIIKPDYGFINFSLNDGDYLKPKIIDVTVN